MTRSALLRQADLERLIRAAAKTDSVLRSDMNTLVVTVLPLAALTEAERQSMTGGLSPDAKEYWSDIAF